MNTSEKDDQAAKPSPGIKDLKIEPPKTEVKNASATGDGTSGEHDGEHGAFKKGDESKPVKGGDQY